MSHPEVTRFAPSPTGLLHVGHVHAALFAEASAHRAQGGKFLLRIEDIDRARCRPEFIEEIEADLAWLGLEWEQPVRRQSEHFDDYRTALDRLAERGLVYPCFCTRSDIAEEITLSIEAPHLPPREPLAPSGSTIDQPPRYPGTCKRLTLDDIAAKQAAGLPFALRLDLDRALHDAPDLYFVDRGIGRILANPKPFGDVVLARKDVPTSYHLAVTIDDALQQVTLVTRGDDLLAASHIHRLLQHLLALPVPDYHHHKIVRDEDGRRLAKRARSQTISELRARGLRPDEVVKLAGFLEDML